MTVKIERNAEQKIYAINFLLRYKITLSYDDEL